MRIRFCPYTGKYGSEKAHISAYFTQCLVELRPTPKYKFCQCAEIIRARIYELFNCAKIKGAKVRGVRNLMRLRCLQRLRRIYVKSNTKFLTHERITDPRHGITQKCHKEKNGTLIAGTKRFLQNLYRFPSTKPPPLSTQVSA